MNADQPFDGADAVAFQEHSESKQHLRRIDASPIHGPGLLVREIAGAGIATITLGAVPIPTGLASFILAEMAQHGKTAFFVFGGFARMRVSRPHSGLTAWISLPPILLQQDRGFFVE